MRNYRIWRSAGERDFFLTCLQCICSWPVQGGPLTPSLSRPLVTTDSEQTHSHLSGGRGGGGGKTDKQLQQDAMLKDCSRVQNV